MAIKLKNYLGNTGLSGDHWALCDLQIRVGVEAGTTDVVARYAMWASSTARTAGKAPLRRSRKVNVTVQGTDPRLSEIEAACDVVLTSKTIMAKPDVRAVVGQPAVNAKAAVNADPDNGIDAKAAVIAKAAVKPVKAQRAVRGVRGGELETGSIV